MFIFGITGGSGAGKSTAVSALVKLGGQALDCDKIYHELLLCCDELINELKARFINITTNGKIDRRKLGEIVWHDDAALQELNDITHKYVSKEIDKRIGIYRKQNEQILAVDAILLIESGQSKKCSFVIGVIAPEEMRLSRIMKRDNLTRKQAEARINMQKPDDFYRNNCNYILENTSESAEDFENICSKYFLTYPFFKKQ